MHRNHDKKREGKGLVSSTGREGEGEREKAPLLPLYCPKVLWDSEKKRGWVGEGGEETQINLFSACKIVLKDR